MQTTILNLVNENKLIEGVKKVSDKVYKYKAIYDRKYVEVTKYEYVNILKGLETVVCYTKENGYDYFEVVETTTGTILSYSAVQNKDKEETKRITIQRAEKLVNELAETGRLIDILTKVSAHITKGISPSYEGVLNDNNDRSGELNNIGIGDRLLFINLRGGLHYSISIVESMKTVTRCNKEVIEYKVIDEKKGYYSYHVFDNINNDSNFYYEPRFVEMMEKASSENTNPQNSEIEAENVEDNEVVTIENTEVLANQKVSPVVDGTEISKLLKEHLTPAKVSDNKYQEFLDIVNENSEKNKDKVVPEAVKEVDKLICENGFVRVFNDMITKINYHIVYFKPLDTLKKYFRLELNNILTEEGMKFRYRIGIAAKSQTEFLICKGEMFELEGHLSQISLLLANKEKSNTELEEMRIVENKSLEDVSNEAMENVFEIAKSPYKTILQQYEGMENFTGHYLYNVIVADDKKSLTFIYKYDKDEISSNTIRKYELEEEPYINGLIAKYPNSCEQQILIRETEINIAKVIFGLFEEKKVYKLEEIVESGINIEETPVLTEDLTVYTDEEFYHKEKAIWEVLHASERLYRWGKAQLKEQLVVKGYNAVIFPLNGLLHKDSMRRGRRAAIAMDEETAKGYALKWIYSDRYQELINKGDSVSLKKSLKHDFYGGTLRGEYGFFIGSITCSSKGASISLYTDMENCSVEKYKMTYKEIADRLIKKYQVKEIKRDIEIVKIKSVEDKATTLSNIDNVKKKQLTLFTLTNEDIEKLSATVKNSRKKQNLIEGQMTLFAI